MQGYKNFHLASYVWAYYLNRTDEAKMRADIETALAQAPIAKVYIENHRGRVDVDQEKLRLAKRVFEEYGIKTAGGITSTVLEGERKPAIMDTFCYTDPRHRERYLNIVRELSEVFDEIILDDYFFTACRCEMCIKAKGKMSWAQYRLGLMEEFSREIVDLAHQVNPKLKFVIKYPNWYESFAENGYNPGKQKDIFDGIYTGTESRSPVWSQQHLQSYMSYFNIRLLENTAPGRNGGGWIDPGGSADNLSVWLNQAHLTFFAKADELMLFNYEWLIGTTLLSMLAVDLKRVDRLMGEAGKPVGVKSYEPYDGDGEDQLPNYLGMMGIPIEPVREFDESAPLLFLAQNACIDKDVTAKLERYLRNGGNAVITSGFFRHEYENGVKDFTSVRLTGRHIHGSEYLISSRNYSGGVNVAGKAEVGFEAMNYKTNSTWADISVQSGEDNFPLFTEDQYGKGRLFILNVPENFADLYQLPAAVRETIAKHMTIGLPLYLGPDAAGCTPVSASRAGGRVNLFAYDNGVFGIWNQESTSQTVRVIVRGDMYGSDETMQYGDQEFMIPGNRGPAGAHTATDDTAKRPFGLADIETGQQFTDVLALPKPSWHLDCTTIIPEPLEYAVSLPVQPGAVRFVRVIW